MSLPLNKIESIIKVDWPAPSNVKALVTTRNGGFSHGVFKSFNLAQHVDDDALNVDRNRALLQSILGPDISPFWLQQTHTNRCVPWQISECAIEADASFASETRKACIVMTADCLPILITNKQGNWVAACHAGWRGLANGIIENTINQYQGNKSELLAWIGPAITQTHFEVASDVRNIFIVQDTSFQKYFLLNNRARYQFDFIGLAKSILKQFEIETFGGNLCSYSAKENFYSYRRDGETGRMASIIWFE